MKKIKICLIIVFILLFTVCIIQIGIYKHNTKYSLTGVIIKVENNSIILYSETEDLTSVSFSCIPDFNFEKNQIIKIYWDGFVASSYPGIIQNVYKVELIEKNNSTIKIPNEIIRNYQNSLDNISFTISNFTTSELQFTISDTNEIPYEYVKSFKIYKGYQEIENIYTEYENNLIKIENNESEFFNSTYTILLSESDLIKNNDSIDGYYTIKIENSNSFSYIIKFKIENNVLTYSTPTIEYI